MDFYDYVHVDDNDHLLSVTFILPEYHYIVSIWTAQGAEDGKGRPVNYVLEYMPIKDMVATMLMTGFDPYESFFFNGNANSLDELQLLIDYTERKTKERLGGTIDDQNLVETPF